MSIKQIRVVLLAEVDGRREAQPVGISLSGAWSELKREITSNLDVVYFFFFGFFLQMEFKDLLHGWGCGIGWRVYLWHVYRRDGGSAMGGRRRLL